ncbi:histidine phosphatase family protein [endosymbiont of Lamellibrachia barhami]|uniref:histidine phosphatase family protein n=1 Tax=endosymbiont of Lamellibrachia barhami TaxID=205975 RepID=UPI0015AEE938|nr:histidine phosphatase family protein [endosymbiont of Lamellibrachia barhami]
MRRIAALIRHGDYHQRSAAPSAHQPYPLNAAGREHAQQAAKEVQDTLLQHNWQLAPVIDSSRMLRGWQTAQIIAETLVSPEATVDSFDALAERGMGCLANLSVAEIEKILQQDPRYPEAPPDWKSNSHYCLPLQGAESLMQAGERVASHLCKRMAELSANDTVDRLKLFVGHGAAFRHAAHHLGVLAFDQIAALSMYHGRPVFLENLPDGSWRQIAGEWKVRGGDAYTD